MGKDWRRSRGGLPSWGEGAESHGLCGETEGPGLLWPHGTEAKGKVVVACNCLRGGFREDEDFLCRGNSMRKEKLWSLSLGMRKMKCHLKGSGVVQRVTGGGGVCL